MIKQTRKSNSVNEDKLYFAIFVLHAIAEKYKKLPSYIYKILIETGAMEEYIFEYYDVLHTMGKKAIVGDLEEYVKHRGKTFC